MQLDIERIEKSVLSHMQAMKTPGFALAIVQDQEICYARGFGVCSTEKSGQAVTPHTLFRIGSVTKPLVGSAIMRLAEQGRVGMDRSIADYLPFDVSPTVRKITLRMLLSHTAGLPTVEIQQGSPETGWLNAFVQQELAQVKFIAPPGKLHAYSNLGFILAGYIAEVVTGQDFPTLMQDLVFKPLGMARTTFKVASALQSSLALPYIQDDEGRLQQVKDTIDNTAGNPAGLALSTVEDLARFTMAFLPQGSTQKRRFLSPASIEEMQCPQADLYTPLEYAYSLGFFTLSYKGTACIMHMGSMLSYIGELRCFPNRGIAVVALSNFCRDHKRWWIVAEISDEVLSLPRSFPAPRPRGPTKVHWPCYKGTYLHDKLGTVTIAVQEDRLILLKGQKTVALDEFRDHVYVGVDHREFVGFIFEGGEPAQYIIINETIYERVNTGARNIQQSDGNNPG